MGKECNDCEFFENNTCNNTGNTCFPITNTPVIEQTVDLFLVRKDLNAPLRQFLIKLCKQCLDNHVELGSAKKFMKGIKSY